ncbi:hydroxymethylbilane synthase [Taibaiella sp. KBW10]|uniref:hydroxymethylbilane synthase n=1 Tax=Taibaiella sp. KBW10 TaxID=2153357 RepID=UPI000F5B3E84|nr:hydroxymethylbilane synthase [Taibaiella sp. KBW10]RQO30263.1 hydroxymethylbilane synthase [Taibaiella sp. KBW10]
MQKILRIGTRDSKLALWQANKVKALLAEKGIASVLVPVKSEGDLDLVTPLYAMGVEGLFTKTLDAYLLSDKIDIAVHSMKDVPTQLAQGIVEAAVLPRASYKDILVFGKDKAKQEVYTKIGTGSVRRKAMLLHKYPDCVMDNLRGNVQTRLQKLADSDWDGAVFAEAGLERMDLLPDHYETLDWMLPAPAQGAIMIVCRSEAPEVRDVCNQFNDADTALCVTIERDFLKALMGGCSTPISALARVHNGIIHFQGNICSPDGKELLETEQNFSMEEKEQAGQKAAQVLLEKGAGKIVAAIRAKGKTTE